ncbi:hypothetical protein [Clostridium sp.]
MTIIELAINAQALRKELNIEAGLKIATNDFTIELIRNIFDGDVNNN